MRKKRRSSTNDKSEFEYLSRRTLHRDLAKFFFSCSETELGMFLVLAALPEILMDEIRIGKEKRNFINSDV